MTILNLQRKVSRSRGVASWSLSQVAVGALLGCALTLLLPWIVRTISHHVSATEARKLAAELGPLRLTMGRMVGQAAYAPYPTPLHQQDIRALRRFCHELMSGNVAPTSESLRNRAFCELALKRLDAAVADLEEAVRMEPGNASLLSDLSAVYGERATAEDRPEDHVAALEMAERAIAIDPKLPEALFNRALGLEHLFLSEEARAEWLHYGKLDGQSLWAQDAKFHSLLCSYRHKTLAEYQPEDYFVTLVSGRQTETPSFLPWWSEAMALHDRLLADPRWEKALQISEALRGFNSTILRSLRPLASAALEAQAVARWYSLNAATFQCDPEAKWGLPSIPNAGLLAGSFRQAVCQFQENNFEGAQAALERLEQDPHLADYPSLQARQQLMLGILAQRRFALTDALAFYFRALDLFIALGDARGEFSARNLIAESLEALGQSSEAWRQRYRTLALAGKLPPTHHLDIALDQAVLASLAQGWPEVALDFQNRLVAVHQTIYGPFGSAPARLRRAQIKAALGRRDAAQRDFDAAIEALHAQPAPHQELAALAAEIDVVRSEIAASGNRAAAIAQDLSARPGGESLRLSGAHADYDFRRGDTVAAEKDLERALEQLEQERSKVAPGGYRISFLDQAQALYERLVALELNLGRPAKALEVLERFRARTLLDQMETTTRDSGEAKRTNATPLSWPELCARMPPRTVIVVYAVVEDRIVTWLVRPSGIEHVWVKQSWKNIAAQVEHLQAQSENSESARRILAGLDQALVSPWGREIHDGDRIIFVPTRSLHTVPFTALIDPISGRFLVQDHAIGIAPSASEFIAAMERDRQISANPPASALLVGNPKTDAAELPALPGTAKEIERLSEIYQGLDTQILKGAAATPMRVLSAIEKAEVVHLAVHGAQDAKDPTRSHLVLSSTRDNPGFLYSRDVLRLHLPRTHVVMLAACETGVGAVSPSEGALSLASSFLAAGVPAVVATLRPIEDASTTRISVRFHQELRRGADALSALRTAQLEEIAMQRGQFDWTWASFQVLGGVAERVSEERAFPEGQVSNSRR